MGKVAYGTEMSVEQRNRELRTKYKSPLIKWYQATMTKEEKYKLGMMTVDEYYEWQAELAAEEEAKKAEEAHSDEKKPDHGKLTAYLEKLVAAGPVKDSEDSEEEHKNHTFWEDDDGDRSNMSNDSYAAFLAQNGVDVSNSNTVDFSALLKESAQANADNGDENVDSQEATDENMVDDTTAEEISEEAISEDSVPAESITEEPMSEGTTADDSIDTNNE